MSDFPLGSVIFFALILGVIYIYYNASKSMQVCKDCGFCGSVIKTTQGSILIEIILWCCFIIPGTIYTIWRFSSRIYQCPSCSSRNIIPANSPIGARLLRKNIETHGNKILKSEGD